MGEKDIEKDTDSELSVKDVEDSLPKVTAREGPSIYLDTGKQRMRYRKRWWQLWCVNVFILAVYTEY